MNYQYNIKQKGWVILCHLFLCILFFTGTRWGFYAFNTSYFQIDNIAELLKLTVYGWRFDLSAIAMVIGLLFFILALPLHWNESNSRLWSGLFTAFLSLSMCFELADWKYFAFNQRRSNIEVLHMISRPSDFLALIPGFIKDYWYLFILAILMVVIIYKLSRFIIKRNSKWIVGKKKQPIFLHLIFSIFILGLVVLGVRGGAQLVPITPRNAIQYTTNENVPIVVNTTFNIITSAQSQGVERLHFYSDEEVSAQIQTIHLPHSSSNFRAKNVVVIILESFSKEFTSLTQGESYTPFLDSLMQHSYVWNNAYANAFQSAQAIPAILAGIPGWMDQSFMTSAYANNNINSLASLLATQGYNSTFYHGATNGSMSFDIFTKNAGYQRYYGRKEYHQEKDFDGNWGIWDEPFLQAVAADMTQQQQPFHSVVFNLNSHPPYSIPKQYQQVFKEGDLPIYKALRYSDYALQQFFKTASQQPWFNQTLFIVTADHASPLASQEFFQNYLGKFQIPIMIFDPSQTLFKPFVDNSLMQQIDILPSIMDTLAYPHAYYALGQNVWKQHEPMLLTKVAKTFYVLKDSIQANFSEQHIQGAYLYPKDSLNQYNIHNDSAYQTVLQQIEKQYKIWLQRYNNDLIDNKMYIKNAK